MLKKLAVHFKSTNGFIITSKVKMVFYLVTIMFLVFIVMNLIFYKMYSENVKQVVLREFNNKVEQTSRYIDLIIERVETTSEVIMNNQMAQTEAVEGKTATPLDVLNRRDVIAFLQGMSTTIEEVGNIDLFFTRTNMLLTTDQGSYANLDQELIDWYLQWERISEIIWTDKYGEKLLFMRERPINQITMVRPFFSSLTGRKAGLIAINLNKRVIMNILSGDRDSNNILINESGKIIVASLMEPYDLKTIEMSIPKIRQALKKGNQVGWVNGINSVFVSRVSTGTGWETISFAPIGPSLMKISQMRNYVLLFLITNFIVLLCLILIISKKMFHPVNKLIGFMKKVEQGNLNVVIEDGRKDEFGYIYSNFNRMVSNIKYLFQELYEEKLLKKDAELKLLQSKISPHFIYNIFNNMSWLLELERYQDLAEMIEAVGRYYKTSLNSGNDFIAISDNIVQLQSYAKIQMIRFKNKFRCDFRIDPKISDVKIPIFILQPLLENAICHGVEPKEDYGIIRVTIRRRKDNLVCTIADNGVGIEKGKLEEIRTSLNEDTLESNRYFALANINKRIKISYGREYGLKIISKKGYGTRVTLTIPGKPELGGNKVV